MLPTLLACAIAVLPPTLTRDGPIPRWDEGLPLGNGLVGVLAWGEGRTLRLSLDRADLWDTRTPQTLTEPGWTWANMIALKREGNHKEHQRLFDVPYDSIPYPTKLPTARVEITLPPDTPIGAWSLVPGSAHARVALAAPPAAPVHGVLVGVHHDDPIVVCTGLPKDAACSIVWPAGLSRLEFPPPECGQDAGERWCLQRTPTGLVYAVALATAADDSGLSLAVAIRTSADSPDPLAAARALAARAIEPAESSRALAQAEHAARSAFDASSVSIPDPRLQLHYDLCKHCFIAGSRDGRPPIALQGVWTADEGSLPPWKGDYHNDLNTQMTYSAYHAAGLFDQGRAWTTFNWNLLPAYTRFAHEFYGLDNAVPRAVVPGVMTIEGRPMGGWGQYSLSPTHSAWVAQAFHAHWKYTGDRAFLRDRALPFCQAVGYALLGILERDEHGHYVLPLSTSPEVHDNSYAAWLPPNSNYDLSLMRWLFAALAEMGREIGDPLVEARWRHALDRLEPLDTDPATGLTFAKGHPYSLSHRHFSHAMAIWPLGTLTIEGTDADRATIAATLDRLAAMGTSQWCGYSFAWMSAMSARAGRPEEALDALTNYLAFTGPNGFHLNGDQTRSGLSNFTYRPFTLEGNFIAMQAVHEMLLQSWGEVGRPGSSVIRVFPAISDRWPDAAFRDLRAEGGVRVSAQRRAGATTRVELAASHAGTVRLRDPFDGRGKWSTPPTTMRDGLLTFDLPDGGLVTGTREP
jgi:alpha-L-fucosidase 2